MNATYTVYDPATLDPVGEAPDMTAEDVDKAVQRALMASLAWMGDREARRAALRACAGAIRQEADQLGNLLSREQGKPVSEARGEFLVGAGVLDYYADLEWDLERNLPPRADRSVTVQNRPVGVVGTITPWNFPISLLLIKLAPALVAGCTVVSKPSPTTPLSTMSLVDLMNKHLPPGVLQWATSARRTVNVALAEHPKVRKLSFTGSTEVGVSLMQTAVPTVKRVTMELGGNDPAIVLDDADVEFTARSLTAAAFRNAGQVCMAPKRIFVPASLEAPILEAMAAAADEYDIGHGVIPGTTLGPMHNRGQLNTVTDLIDSSLASGGQVVTGAQSGSELPGYFLAPTVVRGLDESARLVVEEQFGAAVPVVVYDDAQGLAERLNKQPWGLGASVWSSDVDRAVKVASAIEAGTVWVNQHIQVEPDAAFGGWRMSGMGRERGIWGLEHYLEQRTLNVRPHQALKLG